MYVNNIYAVRLTASASKSRVIHLFFGKLIGNLEWVFFSGFFMRYIVDQLEQGKNFSEIFAFILICGVVTGIMASFLVLWTMYHIDPVPVLFVFCPLIGNFLFGNLKNKFEYMRYQEEAPKDKVLNYVNRVLYLPDYAKEIRLSRVFRLLK